MRILSFILILTLLVIPSCTVKPSHIKVNPNNFVYLGKVVKLDNCPPGLSCKARTIASGFIIGNRGGDAYAMTAGHFCLDGPGESSAGLSAVSPSGEKYSAIVMRAYKEPDICFLQIKGLIAPSVVLSNKGPRHGEKVSALSAPFGLFNKGMLLKFEGHYSGYSTKVNKDTYTIPTRPGSSGSPVFNSEGRLIGMLVMAFGPLENVGFGVEYSVVKNHILAFRRDLKL